MKKAFYYIYEVLKIVIMAISFILKIIYFILKKVANNFVCAGEALLKGEIYNFIKHLFYVFRFFFIIWLISMSLYIYKMALVGEYTPYKYSHYYGFQTKNKEFTTSFIVNGTGEEKALDKQKKLQELEQKFNEFKQKNPQYKDLKLYVINPELEVKLWKFWTWAFYEPSITDKYPYLDVKNN